MRNALLVLRSTLLTATFLLLIAGCGANVRTYTFEKERPDQKLAGNRGYLTGEAPPDERREEPKRTMVGIDIELP